MCGIFAYLNYLTPKKRCEIISILIQGLQRMEYRGYDSAGIAIDGNNDPHALHDAIALLRKAGKVSVLAESVKESSARLHFGNTNSEQIGDEADNTMENSALVIKADVGEMKLQAI
ncbi:hypothetical protein KIN20_005305 [Parelaphostrongylus tenuis]|uniref:glutamine--fructose-6-phosphate transaminase (isomerizing) n=1 Tax=Parelaphostrongylus tenuis TaxID=148309 RepID=A0AAD5QHD3_PARTN|nr:hypothetical protein KIN20_005305 [Parelaphostrongylus tenuis]